MSQEYSRRGFVKSAASAVALAAGPAILPAFGAADRVSLGWIGTGTRGRYLIERAYAGNASKFKVTALCDTFNVNLAKGKDIVQTQGTNTPKTYTDYRELLADKEVDAVFIATPEHLHHRMLLDAIAAGKTCTWKSRSPIPWKRHRRSCAPWQSRRALSRWAHRTAQTACTRWLKR